MTVTTPSRQTPSRGTSSFLFRSLGLFAGIFFGQGSVFVLQTALLTQGKAAETASFGFGFAALTLAQWTADWGGALLQGRSRSAGVLHYIESCAARLCVAPSIILAQVVFAIWYSKMDALTAGMLVGGSLVPVFWAINGGGWLDAMGRSAVSGPLLSLPPACAALSGTLLLRLPAPSFGTGVCIGAAFTVGTLACVCLQTALILKRSDLFRFGDVRWTNVKQHMVAGAYLWIGDFPSQLYARALLFLVNQYVASDLAGTYVYIRQLVSASAQGLNVIKRVELPSTRMVAQQRAPEFFQLLRMQIVSFCCSLLPFIASLALFGWADHAPPKMAPAFAYLPYFLVSLPIWSLAFGLGQFLVLSGAVRLYSTTMLVATLLCYVTAAALVPRYGLSVLWQLDLLSFFGQVLLFYASIRRRR